MTVKIVESQPILQVLCNNCGTRHEYSPTDTKEGIDDGESYRYIKCLHCIATIRLKPWGVGG